MPDQTATVRGAQTDAAEPALMAGWPAGLSIVNLRGDPLDPAFCQGVERALAVALPTQPCSTAHDASTRIVWAGPDDWFVISCAYAPAALCALLREHLQSLHCAVTDVTSGYRVLRLRGSRVREALAQGCPLDLHPKAFHVGQSAGSVFFKASVWLWQTGDEPTFEVLVRSSFQGYVGEMLERVSRESGLCKWVQT